MQNINEQDPLMQKIVIDPKSIKKNPYASRISNKQALIMAIQALFDDSKLTKDEFKEEVNIALS